MAEPLRNGVYDRNDENPVTRPDLRAIDGGGETTAPQQGHLRSVDGGGESTSQSGSQTTSGRPDLRLIRGGEEAAEDGGQSASDKVGRGFTLSDEDREYLKNLGMQTGRKAGTATLARLSSKLLNTKQGRIAIVGFLGGLIVPAIFLYFILSGPMQFVQFAQFLQRAHFVSGQAFLAHRGSLLLKYARTADTPIERNMGYFGNKFADHADKKLRNAGIETEYNNRRLQKLIIDPSTTKGKMALDKIREGDFNTNELPKNSSGKVVIELDSGTGSARQRRHTITAIGNVLDLGVINGAMTKRVLKLRAAVSFHPLKNIARNADESLRDYRDRVKEEREKKIKTGVQTGPKSTTTGAEVDGEGNDITDPKIREAAEQANDITNDSGTPINEKVDKLKNNLTKGTGALGVVTMICAVKGLGDASGEVQKTNITEPLMRTGVEVSSIGSQIQANNKNVNMDELGAHSEYLFDDTTQTSWKDARSIQAEEGEELTGPDIVDSSRPGKSKPWFFAKLDSVLNPIPGANTACSAVNSTAGGFIISVGSVVLNSGGPFTAALNAASEGGMYLASRVFMESILRWISGEQVNVAAAGADLGNNANYGYLLAANEASLSYGGAELSQPQVLVIDQERHQSEIDRQKNQSYYARYIDPFNSQSLLANSMSRTVSRQTDSFATTMIGLPTNFMKDLSKNISSIWTPRSYAAETYDYGFPEYGFSIDEIDDSRFQDPYENARQVEPHLEELNEKYGIPCFGTTVDPNTFSIDSNKNGSMEYGKIPDECKDRSNELLVRYRFYLADMTVANCTANYEGIDEEGCNYGDESTSQSETPTQEVGNSTFDITQLESNSDHIACGPGTKDLGKQNGYKGGRLIKIRLCEIPNLPQSSGFGSTNGHATTNSVVSGAVYAMVEAAKKDGVTMKATSTFRTMADQQSLCPCDGVRVGRPGYSNHQLGVAIDFGGDGTLMNKSNPMWVWLDKNAEKFGYKPYAAEDWHWSPFGS